jgi:hypothetical protein
MRVRTASIIPELAGRRWHLKCSTPSVTLLKFGAIANDELKMLVIRVHHVVKESCIARSAAGLFC